MLSKTQQVWRHLIVSASKNRRHWPSLRVLAAELDMGVSSVHAALAGPAEMGAVFIRRAGGISADDTGQLLMYWAARRNLAKDVVRRFQVAPSAYETEAALGEDPQPLILGGFGAVLAAQGANTIADYSTVLVYGEPSVLTPDPDGKTEVIVAEPDPLLAKYGRTTPLCQAWADLFCLPGWQAARFVNCLLDQVVRDADYAQ